MARCFQTATLLAGLSLSLVWAVPATAQSDLSGRWRVDSTRSADIEQALLRHAQQQGFRQQGATSQAGPGTLPGGSTGAIQLSGSRASAEAIAAEAQAMVYGGDHFELRQTDSTVVILPLNLAHDPVYLTTDGKERKETLVDGIEVELKARWDDDRLKVERSSDDVDVTEYWLLAEDPDYLIVKLEFRGRLLQKKLDVLRIYQREP